MDALGWHRFQFGFTIAFHYLFPQLTIGLALLILVFKVAGLRGSRTHDDLARFWGRLFGINFAVGVVTGIPLEFQFGTNWAAFSEKAGGVIGVTLALEGMFAFFAESAFLGLFLFRERKLGPKGHLFAAFMVFLGSWASSYFIIVTNAFMQHPAGHEAFADGRLELADPAAYLLNPWAIWEFSHVVSAGVITGSFVVSAVGAYWALSRQHGEHARAALRTGAYVGLVACLLQLFPTGDQQGKLVAEYQRPGLAAMEGKFESSSHAELAIIGQPNLREHRLENPIVVPAVLSFLAYGTFGATVTGLDDVPLDRQPDHVELLYYAYHVMVGLGTLLTAVMAAAAALAWAERLHTFRPLLWVLMLAFPFPYIATTAGWMTAELGRQPWLVYGLLRTANGASANVATGDVIFTTLGFMGLYLLLGVLFLLLVLRRIAEGPEPRDPHPAHSGAAA
jgi:cytochrome d ubiquinol oxidase subunit I